MTEDDATTYEAMQILEGISAVAAERRDEAQRAINRPLPSWLLEIMQTEVVYTIATQSLRLRTTSFATLNHLLREKYSVVFQRPTLGPIPVGVPISDDELGAAVIRTDDHVRFEDGKFMRTATDFDVIRSIRINYETIDVVVEGVSEVAELVVADVAEMISAAAGAQRRWDQIKPGTQLIGYGSVTLVDLGVPFENLLSAELRGFAATQMLSGRKFAYESGRRSARHNFGVSPQLTAVWGLDDLTIKIFLFDQLTGRPEETKMNLTVRSRDEMGTGRVVAFSELPFQKHVECIEQLRSAIAAP